MDDEVRLAGGNMEPVHRRGDEVLRTAGEWTPAVHRLMRHCRDRGVLEVPEPLGLEPDGRERIAWQAGRVPVYPLPEWVWSEPALVGAAELLRRFHDATADADRTGPWRSIVREPDEVVRHNDFSPHNLVFDDGGLPVGIIDFDYAAPGPRAWDLGYLVQRMAPLTTDRADGFSDDERLARVRLALDAYSADPRPCPRLSVDDVLAAAVDRLVDLAGFSRVRAVELGKPELAEHAKLYDRDAVYVTGLRER